MVLLPVLHFSDQGTIILFFDFRAPEIARRRGWPDCGQPHAFFDKETI
jgi:hypothetical protein